MLRRSVVAAPSLLFVPQAHAQGAPINWGSILIYQAEILDQVMPNEQALSEYIRRLHIAAEREAHADTGLRSAGVLFVALSPDGRHRVWILATSDRFHPDTRSRWENALSAVPALTPPGYFLFGLAFGVGGEAPHQGGNSPPIPAEWEAQIPPGGTMLDDSFIGRVWPPQN
jgi:hypothetical protein